jgi:methylated-DNA-[protein]-cysteine S-methyltransferase
VVDGKSIVPQSGRLAESRVRDETRGAEGASADVARATRVSVREARLAPRTRMMLVPTPFGRDLLVAAGDDGVTESRFVSRIRARARVENSPAPHPLLCDVAHQLEAYFAGRLRRFEVPLVLEGTPFAIEVWRAVAQIPTGALASYAEIAAAIGRPSAHRGVARALASTPLALLIPAHRVVGADGRVKGASPNSMRRRLLAFEGIEIR